MRELHFPGSTRCRSRITISEFALLTLIGTTAAPRGSGGVPVRRRRYLEARVARRRGGAPARFLFYPATLWKHQNHDLLLRASVSREERDCASISLLTGFANAISPIAAEPGSRGRGSGPRAGYSRSKAGVPVSGGQILVFPSLC